MYKNLKKRQARLKSGLCYIQIKYFSPKNHKTLKFQLLCINNQLNNYYYCNNCSKQHIF